ncbi:MAG: hypothetical protein JNJ77_06095 [Planctomycetia bacterium]|nr:hypothetical protein [Planctomycetia bacterium]
MMLRCILMMSCSLMLLTGNAVAHDGPHGGELFCDGKHKHHAEWCLDAKTGKATIYVLDKKAKNETPIKAETIVVKFKGLDKPLAFQAHNIKEGKSSQFVLQHDRFKSKFKPSDITMEIVMEEGKPAVVFHPEHEDDD